MLTVFITDTEAGFEISRYESGGAREIVGKHRSFPNLHDFGSLQSYLEDYIKHPVGVFADHAQRVVDTEMRAWGLWFADSMFEDQGPISALRATIVERLRAGDPVTIVIESEQPAVHALPWELMLPQLAPRLPESRLAVLRSFGAFDAGTIRRSGSRLLIVIARPAGARDVDHQIIARQVMRWNIASGKPLRIDVLRPPSFGQFEQALAAAANAGQPYDLVHFDGHGDFVDDVATGAIRGCLIFETDSGGPDAIGADGIASALIAGEVKLVILNACRSGAVSGLDQTAHGVATRILASKSAIAIVAMTHNVQVRAAELFVSAFYGAYLSGNPVTHCVSAGRNALIANPGRASTIGVIPLQDWMIPVLYAAGDLHFEHAAPFSGDTMAATTWAPPLVGRDDGFLNLERMLQSHIFVHLHGSVGIGKTAMAEGFGEWISLTGGLGKEKAGARGWLRLTGWPPDRSTPLPEAPLVILDDIDHVSVFSTANEVRVFVAALFEILRDIAKVGGRLILITRSGLPWLRFSTLGVQRLGTVGAAALASTHDHATRSAEAETKDDRLALMRRLAGHPGAIGSVWRHLETTTASELIAALDGKPTPVRDLLRPDTQTSAALQRSLAFLRRDLRPYFALVALSLGVADALTLKLCLMRCGVARSPADADELALSLLRAAWAAGAGAPTTQFPLEDATDLDLLLHPMRLHPQLALAFTALSGPQDEEPAQWQAEMCWALAQTHADLAKLVLRDIEHNRYRHMVFHALALQRDTLVRSLDLLFDRQVLGDAAILFGLIARVDRETSGDEKFAKGWTDRLLRQVGNNPAAMTGEARLAWLATYCNEATNMLQTGEIGIAELMFEAVRQFLESGIIDAPSSLALCYRMLGQVNGRKTTIADAEAALGWFGKAIELSRAHDNKFQLACGLHDRATVLAAMNDLTPAENDALEAVDIRDEINDRRQLAQTYKLLSSIARGRANFDEAEQYSDLAAIAAGVSQDPIAQGTALMARVNASFLMGEQAKDDLTQAIECFLHVKASPQLAAAYLQMSQVLQMEGEFDAAAEWIRHAAEAARKTGDTNLIVQVSQAEQLLARNRAIVK